MKHALWIIMLLTCCHGVKAGLTTESIEVEGRTREYLLYQPANRDSSGPAPLVLVFHGGGGHAMKMVRSCGFNALADQHGFFVVYPEGVNAHWNDGRKSEKFAEQDKTIDDVAFIKALIARLKKDLPVDPNRVFATGASNGGMFSHRVGHDLADEVAAIAPLIANVPEPLAETFKPAKPVSVLMINGTEDPMVPYAGGPVVVKLFPGIQRRSLPDRGRVVHTDESVKRWLAANQLKGEPKHYSLPDKDPKDGCTVEVTEWADASRNLRVSLFKIDGGGHTWPGGAQYLPQRVVGRVCRDFDASAVIWQFFSRHGRTESP